MSKAQFPLKHFSDNLIFNTKGEVWAVYELKGFTYDYKGSDAKHGLLYNVSRLIANIDTEAKIHIYPIARQTSRQFNKLRERTKGDVLEKEATEYFNQIENYLKEQTIERGNINDYQFFLSVKLKNVVLEKSIREIALDLPRAINTALSVENKYILKTELELYKKASQNVLRNLRGNVYMIEAGQEQVQWMLARMMLRGTGCNAPLRKNLNGKAWKPRETVAMEKGEEAIYPHTNELKTLFEGKLTHKKKQIIVETEDAVSHQSFLQFSHIPDGIAFPGGEFLKTLYDFPVASEICITMKMLEYKKAIDKLHRQASKIEGQIQHTLESGQAVPENLAESDVLAAGLENEIQENNDPLVETTISICVSSDTEEQLDKDVAMVRNYYKDNKYRLERAAQDQLMSFYQFIPGTPIYDSDYKFQLPPVTLAGSMFLATKELGDYEGSYIGTIGIVDKPIYFTPFLAPKKQRSAACFFMGTLGGGKSFNSNLITYTTIMQGAKALIIDPKAERGMWGKELPELGDNIHITTLTSKPEDKGKLDPFNIYREDREEAAELARNILIELFKIESKSPVDVILAETLVKVKKAKVPSMELVHQLLYKVPKEDEYYKEARSLARLMRNTKNLGMASLLFGTGIEKGLSFDARVNILQIDGLNMPEPTLTKSEYNESQRLSTVLMIPISSFAKKFASANREEPKTILLDESWALRQTTEGKNLFNYLARTGRSLNCCTIFIGHSVKDIDDDGLKAAITFKFCFKVNTKEEAIASLKFMELEPTQDNVDTLMTMPNGHALFKDLNNNVDVLKFDYVLPHIKFAFDTNPDKYKK